MNIVIDAPNADGQRPICTCLGPPMVCTPRFAGDPGEGDLVQGEFVSTGILLTPEEAIAFATVLFDAAAPHVRESEIEQRS